MKIIEIEPIFTSEEIRSSFEQTLHKSNHEFKSYNSRPADENEFISRACDADAIIVSNIPFTSAMIEQCQNLKMISVAFTGIDHIDEESCNKRAISIKNAAGYSTQSVAELTLGMTLDLLRKITQLDLNTRSFRDREGFVGLELAGKTVGIIGAGAIGEKVGIMMHALGCKVLFTGRTQKSDTQWGTFASMDDLLAKSDIITLHTPLNSDSAQMINTSTIAKMKKGVFLVNTARGKVVDYTALSQALQSGQVAGAAIDVYETEPPIPNDHPLLSAPNCVLTPHIAYATKEALHRRADIAAKNILQWLETRE